MSLGRCGIWTLLVSKRGEGTPRQVPGTTGKEEGKPAEQVRGGTDTLLSLEFACWAVRVKKVQLSLLSQGVTSVDTKL